MPNKFEMETQCLNIFAGVLLCTFGMRKCINMHIFDVHIYDIKGCILKIAQFQRFELSVDSWLKKSIL